MLKSILFICVENRARSQIAEGLARHFIGHQYDVFSAGSCPADRVHPMATAVMAEIGVDISKQKPKSIETINLEKMDLIIALCAEEQCPVLPSKVKKLNWAVKDPAQPDHDPNAQIRRFRKIRDEIREKVLTLRASDQTW
jgi:arsenate reductase